MEIENTELEINLIKKKDKKEIATDAVENTKGEKNIESFQNFNLPEQLLSSLSKMGFDKPTPVQAQVIPYALDGKDVLGSAQTGTGKTGAFGIPLIANLMKNNHAKALILTPTRELALQVMNMMKLFLGKKSENIKTALLIGGEDIRQQLRQLKSSPRIFVGTPGRVFDHIRRGSINLNNVEHFVLDETDRMLDMGFAPQIEEIWEFLPKEKQVLMFSATFPKNILNMSRKYLNEPVRVTVGEENAPAAKLVQEVVYISESEKYAELIKQLNGREGSVIIFVKTKFGAERMSDRLGDDFFDAEAMHGDLKHSKRERVIESFRKEKYRIMVATDIAARGLDISHVKHVINFDLPQCPEDYIHRIGRTARAGAEGSALCFVTPGEKRKWGMICDLISKKFISKFTESGEKASNQNDKSAFMKKKRDSFNSRDRNSSFKPRERSDSFKPRERSDSFKPRDRDDSFNSRDGNSAFKPRDRDDAFKPRERSDSFKPRDRRDSFNSRDGNSAFKPRAQNDSFRSRDRSDSFRTRDRDDSFKPRSQNSSFKPRAQNDSFRPVKKRFSGNK